MHPPELYIWHERELATTTSRFYFAKELTHALFRSQIKPIIGKLPRVANDHGVRGYPNYVAAHWNHVGVEPYGNTPHHDARLHIERTAELVLTRALGWRAAILHPIDNEQDAIRIANELSLKHGLELNWSKGQHEL